MTRTKCLGMVVVLLLGWMLASGGMALAHGAAVGIHIHLEPNPSAPGSEVRAVVDAEWPLASFYRAAHC